MPAYSRLFRLIPDPAPAGRLRSLTRTTARPPRKPRSRLRRQGSAVVLRRPGDQQRGTQKPHGEHASHVRSQCVGDDPTVKPATRPEVRRGRHSPGIECSPGGGGRGFRPGKMKAPLGRDSRLRQEGDRYQSIAGVDSTSEPCDRWPVIAIFADGRREALRCRGVSPVADVPCRPRVSRWATRGEEPITRSATWNEVRLLRLLECGAIHPRVFCDVVDAVVHDRSEWQSVGYGRGHLGSTSREPGAQVRANAHCAEAVRGAARCSGHPRGGFHEVGSPAASPAAPSHRRCSRPPGLQTPEHTSRVGSLQRRPT